MPRKPLTIPKLKKKLDRLFSLYIRHRDSFDGENLECITCGKVVPIKEAHCGHHISRAVSPTRYSETNCAGQCAYDNVFREGAQWLFGPALRLKHGDYAYEQMLEESRQPWKWERQWLEERIAHYQAELRSMNVRF